MSIAGTERPAVRIWYVTGGECTENILFNVAHDDDKEEEGVCWIVRCALPWVEVHANHSNFVQSVIIRHTRSLKRYYHLLRDIDTSEPRQPRRGARK